MKHSHETLVGNVSDMTIQEVENFTMGVNGCL